MHERHENNLDQVIGQLRWQVEIKRKQAKELLMLSTNESERQDDFRRSAVLQEQAKDLERAIDILREAAVVQTGKEESHEMHEKHEKRPA